MNVEYKDRMQNTDTLLATLIRMDRQLKDNDSTFDPRAYHGVLNQLFESKAVRNCIERAVSSVQIKYYHERFVEYYEDAIQESYRHFIGLTDTYISSRYKKSAGGYIKYLNQYIEMRIGDWFLLKILDHKRLKNKKYKYKRMRVSWQRKSKSTRSWIKGSIDGRYYGLDGTSFYYSYSYDVEDILAVAASVNPKHAICLYHKYILGKSYEVIDQETGYGFENVKSYLKRGRETIRNKYSP